MSQPSIPMAPTTKKLLVINPNTSITMTNGLAKLIEGMYPNGNPQVQIDFYTAPSGPGSIDNDEQALDSAQIVIADLKRTSKLANYDAFLVACYSVHPLVAFLRTELKRLELHAYVIGIFEASIIAALCLLPKYTIPKDERHGDGAIEWKFGIVSTGKYWEKALSDGVKSYLGTEKKNPSPPKIPLYEYNTRFAGVATTGLNADQLHKLPEEVVRPTMKAAIKWLMGRRDNVKVIILGCAGMAGIDSIVEEALFEKGGEQLLKQVIILDGVKAGIGILENLLKTLALPEREAEIGFLMDVFKNSSITAGLKVEKKGYTNM